MIAPTAGRDKNRHPGATHSYTNTKKKEIFKIVANAVEKVTGAENIIWDLGVFYSSPDDPKLTSDMASLTQQVEAFAQQYKGKVAQFDAETMMDALNELEAI